uniref:Leucine-rich repeat-containing protein 58 n=2 Tax=Cacopsylla melanoneura TaxID=428564 RepID=A0A8D9A002_9HEMI
MSYNYGSSSSSDSSDSDSFKTVSIKTLDFSYSSLDSKTLAAQFELLPSNDLNKRPENIDTLLLYHNNISSFPLNGSKFTNLRLIDLSNNRLTHLPQEITSFPLTTLIARNNLLTVQSLPKDMSGLKNLKVLNLSGNELTKFPMQILDIHSLKYLYLGNNLLDEIPREINKLCKLHVLSLGGNVLTEIPETFGHLYELEALILSDNLLESLPASIANLKLLKSLLLHNNKLRTLPTEIITLKCLSQLSLRDNPLVIRFVSDMMYNPPSLLELASRTLKVHEVDYSQEPLPQNLVQYLDSAHHCVNPKCKGVFFDNRIEHIKFVDFCGKYRVPLLQYLCSSRCITNSPNVMYGNIKNEDMMKKVLLG